MTGFFVLYSHDWDSEFLYNMKCINNTRSYLNCSYFILLNEKEMQLQLPKNDYQSYVLQDNNKHIEVIILE